MCNVLCAPSTDICETIRIAIHKNRTAHKTSTFHCFCLLFSRFYFSNRERDVNEFKLNYPVL